MEITFRRAIIEDAPQVLGLLTERHYEVHPDTASPFEENGTELFRATISTDSSYIIVCELSGTIIATATVYLLHRIRLGGYFALLESVLVTKTARGKGIGTKLISFVISECKKDKRIKKIKLGSKKDEEGVHLFYEKLGFTFKEKLFQQTVNE